MYEYSGLVTEVIDGDTIQATVDLGFHLTAVLRFRLLGVNSPEMHGDSAKAGEAAKEYTINSLLNKRVTLKTEKADAFGRWLATVILSDGTNFNEKLLADNQAVVYKRK